MLQKKVALIEVRSPWGALLRQTHLVRNGVTVPRNWANISETLEPNETFLEAAVRGLKEELGLRIHPRRLAFRGAWEEVKPSPTTGATTAYQFEVFSLALSGEELGLVPESSVEDDGTTVHFTWDPVLLFQECGHCEAVAPPNEAGECSVCGGK